MMRSLAIRWTLALGLVPGLVGVSEAAPRKAPTKAKSKAPPLRHGRIPVTVPALLARSRPAREGQVIAPAIEMEHVTSHAHHILRPDVRGGGFSPRQMRGLMDFLRCHHTNKRKPMAPRLISLLYATARHYGNAKIHVIAGYRAPQVALAKGNPKSPHKRGVACDFRLQGVALTELRDYLRRSYPAVGVGYYPNSGFVHLDVDRKQSAYWIDYSSPGERARYAGGAAESEGEAEAQGVARGQDASADPPAHRLAPDDGTERAPSPHKI